MPSTRTAPHPRIARRGTFRYRAMTRTRSAGATRATTRRFWPTAGATNAQKNAIAPRPPRRHHPARQGHSCLPQAFCPPRRSVIFKPARLSNTPRVDHNGHGTAKRSGSTASAGPHRRNSSLPCGSTPTRCDVTRRGTRAARLSARARHRRRTPFSPSSSALRHRAPRPSSSPHPFPRAPTPGGPDVCHHSVPDHRATPPTPQPRPDHGAPPHAAPPTVPVECGDCRSAAARIGRRHGESAPCAPCCRPAGRTRRADGFCRAEILTHTGLSHSWSPSTPAATTPETIANA